MWALAIAAASFVCFIIMVRVRVMGFWERYCGRVTYGVCVGEWGRRRMDGGIKKYKGLERQKRTCHSYRVPSGRSFSNRQRFELALSFRHGVTKGGARKLGNVRYSQSPGSPTHIRLFPILVGFGTRNTGQNQLSQAWMG